VPVLRHDGQTIAQTSVILPYVAQATGRYGGRDAAENRRILEWLNWETGRLTAGIAPARFARLVQKVDPAIQDFLNAKAKDALTQLERLLTGPFLLGERATVADLSACAYTFLVGDAGLDIKQWPRTAAWLDRIRALPGFKPQHELIPLADTNAA
jgi:glutathione S-transferase